MITAGSAPPPSVMRRMKAELGVEPLASYGLTEVRRLGAWFGLAESMVLEAFCVVRGLRVLPRISPVECCPPERMPID